MLIRMCFFSSNDVQVSGLWHDHAASCWALHGFWLSCMQMVLCAVLSNLTEMK